MLPSNDHLVGSVYRGKAIGYEPTDFRGMARRLFVLRQVVAGDGLDLGLRARTQGQFHECGRRVVRIADILRIQWDPIDQ